MGLIPQTAIDEALQHDGSALDEQALNASSMQVLQYLRHDVAIEIHHHRLHHSIGSKIAKNLGENGSF